MKVIVLSDLHGFLPEIVEKFDLMLICGDISPVDMPHMPNVQKEWLFSEFIDWINELPFNDNESKVVMIAGNHDFYLENISRKPKDALRHTTNGRLVYLDNEEYEFQGKKIFGCPYCKPFGNWAFMKEDMDKYYSFIPNGMDFLICHDSPDINNLGMLYGGRWAGTNAGNKVLAEYVRNAKPKYCFSGHLHSGNHNLSEENGINFANVSIMNEDYIPTYKPLIIEVD